MIQRQIIGNREEPCGKLGARAIALVRLVDAKKHFLAQVLCLLAVTDQVEQDPHQAILVPFDQRFERPSYIRANLDHEPDIRITRLQLLFQILGLSAHRGSLPLV